MEKRWGVKKVKQRGEAGWVQSVRMQAQLTLNSQSNPTLQPWSSSPGATFCTHTSKELVWNEASLVEAKPQVCALLVDGEVSLWRLPANFKKQAHQPLEEGRGLSPAWHGVDVSCTD